MGPRLEHRARALRGARAAGVRLGAAELLALERTIRRLLDGLEPAASGARQLTFRRGRGRIVVGYDRELACLTGCRRLVGRRPVDQVEGPAR